MGTQVANDSSVRDLSTLLLPIVEQVLLVPNVSVAEILDYRETEVGDDVPNWYLGLMQWRTRKVPILSFEAINDQPFFSRSDLSRVAIFNGIVDSDEMPFWGLVTQGTPRQMKVMPEELKAESELSCGPAEKMAVLVNGESARIPDLEYIEEQLLALLAQA